MSWLENVVRGVPGILVFLFIAWALSSHRKSINWRIVGAGLTLQFLIAILVLNFKSVAIVFTYIGGFFSQVSDFTKVGSEFVFGSLASGDGVGFVFAFQILPTVIFFSALTSLLYYLGVLQWVVKGLAWVMSRAMKLSGAESLAMAANVFLGQTEAPLMIKPYINKMSRSEIMALMTGGMATIAGAVMVAYIAILGGDDPEGKKEFAKILLCASLMNAPAALALAKIMEPEMGEVDRDLKVSKEKVGSNMLESIANGTSEGLKLALNIGAMLIVFVALIAMIDYGLGNWVGVIGSEDGNLNTAIASASDGQFTSLSLGAILGYVFAPIAWLIGASGELLSIGKLLGMKMVSNEFFAFMELGQMKDAGTISSRNVFLSTFALCGFANFSSIGIQLGGIGVLAPERKSMIAALGMKALIAGTLASLLSATVAGMVHVGG
ncbi:MAG: NupC/NupG family nucleoside CNT transporter [Akkermansiaceae bacterium]